MCKRAAIIAACTGFLLATSALSDQLQLTGQDWKKLDQSMKQNMARQSVKLTRPTLNHQEIETAAEGVMTCMNSELSEDESAQFADQELVKLLAYCLRITR